MTTAGSWQLGPEHPDYAGNEHRPRAWERKQDHDRSSARPGSDRVGDGRDRGTGSRAHVAGATVTRRRGRRPFSESDLGHGDRGDRTPLGTHGRGTPARGIRITPLGWAHVSLDARARIGGA